MGREASNISHSEAKALVNRIAASPGLERSPRLQELLRFLADASLSDRPSPLTEQQVGEAVFKRSPQYDTTSDTIVRVQVSQLRKRLEHYYLTEGESEVLFLEVPRGSYNAVFRPRAVPSMAAEAPLPHVERSSGRRVRFLTGAVAILSVLCAALAFLLWRADEPAGSGPAVRALWSNLLRPQQKATIVLADSVFGFLQDAQRTPMDLDRYLRRDPQQWAKAGNANPELEAALQLFAFRQYTSIADVNLMRRILTVFPPSRADISVVWARNYNARAASSENVVFLGTGRSNPWVQIYAGRLNFQFETDEAAHKGIIRNLKPAPGESDVYRVSGEGAEIREGYAVLALLPNVSLTGHVLLLAGTDMEATEAVGTVATTESELARIAQKIGVRDRFPAVEILFQTRRLGGAPQEIHMVAFRRK
jgi:hypothetical protein